MKNFKVMALAIMGMISVSATAQDKVEGTVAADLVSTYMWRGQKMDALAVQPTLGISYKGLSLTGWGSYGLTNSSPFSEFDLTLAYTTGGFNIGITDYWNNGGSEKRYFKYGSSADQTNHTYEANIGYDFGPLAIQWYTNFAGFDGVNKDGKRAYTSYFELSAPFQFAGLDWTATVGAVPFASYGYYLDKNSSGFAVTNASLKASKDIKITDSFSLPVFAQVVGNPSAQTCNFVFGFTLQP